MNHPIPRKPRIINNDMNLAIPELSRLLHQRLDICIIENIPRDGDGPVRARGVDGVGCVCGFFCMFALVSCPFSFLFFFFISLFFFFLVVCLCG